MQQPNPDIKVVPARRGWRWLMQAGDIIGRFWPAFLLLGLMWAGLAYIRVIPLLGGLIVMLLTPALQAGVMYAVARAANRQTPRAADLFAVLSSDRRSEMLQLGALIILAIFMFVMILGILAGALVPELLTAVQDMQEIEDLQRLNISLLDAWLFLAIVLMLVALISLAFFFAVPRVAFDHQSPGAALGESFRACLRNWRAMVFFGLAQIVVGFAAFVMLSLLLLPVSLIGGTPGLLIQSLLVNVVVMLLQVLVSGGQYLAWLDIFERSDSAPENTEEPSSQDSSELIA